LRLSCRLISFDNLFLSLITLTKVFLVSCSQSATNILYTNIALPIEKAIASPSQTPGNPIFSPNPKVIAKMLVQTPFTPKEYLANSACLIIPFSIPSKLELNSQKTNA
jgi:hypothetical protein